MSTELEIINAEIKKLKKKCCCGAGGFKDITYEESLTLIEENKVQSGILYRITGVHKNKVDAIVPVLYDDGTNSGTTIYVWGITDNEFSTEGWGEFWNPKYDQTNYGNIDLQVGQQLEIIDGGTGFVNATNVGVNSEAGSGMTIDIIVTAGVITTVTINTLGTGYVNGDTIVLDPGGGVGLATLTINSLPYLYNIWDGNNPSITGTITAPGRKIIWGGYVWEAINGNVGGGATSAVELFQEDWTKIPYNTTDYDFVIDYIEYDWANDWISRRRCGEKVIDITFPYQYWNSIENTYGVILHGISVTQWGNHYNAVTELGNGLVNVNDAYYENINFKGKVMLGIEADMYSVNRNCYFGINTEFRDIRVKGKSYQTNNIFDTGGKQIDHLLENQSWQDLIVVKNLSSQIGLRIINGSWQNGAENSMILDNNSSQGGVSLMNGSYQQNIMDNSSEIDATYINGAYSQFQLIDSTLSFWHIDATVVGHILDTCIKSNLTFKNGLSIFPVDTNTTEKYSIYGNTSNEFNFKITFTGAADLGAVGAVKIPLYMLNPSETYIEEVSITSKNLSAGAGSYITLGILTDDVDSGLDIVTGLVTTINNTTQRYTNLPFTKTAAADRYIVMAVGANAITGGTVVINVKTRYGNFI